MSCSNFNKWALILNHIRCAVANGILPFKPGLVGGHCIGVDPYYLTYKAQRLDTILKLYW